MPRRASLALALAPLVLIPTVAFAQIGAFGATTLPSRRGTLSMAGLRLFNPPTMGPRAAPVRVVAFVDYQCPYSARSYRAIRDTSLAMPGVLQASIAHYPLDGSCNPALSSAMHPQACLAARAAICAQRQGRFWEMSDQLFAMGRALDPAMVDAAAAAAQLDMPGYAGCMTSQLPDHHIAQDVAVAQQIPVRGTPLLIINDGTHPGSIDQQRFEALVRHLAAGGTW